MRLYIILTIVCLLGFALPPVHAQTPAIPSLGSSTFFADVKARLTSSKTKEFHGIYLDVSGTEFKYDVFKAEDQKMETYVVPTSGVGTIIDDVVSANPTATLILNGAQFSYGTSNHPHLRHPLADQEPMVTIGNVVSGGSVISTNASAGARRMALKRYWLAENYSIADAGSAASYFFSEPPIGTKGDPPLDDAALGGLVSLIMPTGHPQTSTDDTDLTIYDAFRLYSKSGNLNPSFGFYVGFNVIGVNRSNGMIIVLTKSNGGNGSIYDAQALLHSSGVDLALITDGGGSTAVWLKGVGYLSKASRHIRKNADGNNTVANYLIFAPK